MPVLGNNQEIRLRSPDGFSPGGARRVGTRLGRMHDEALKFVPRIKVKGQHTADNGVV